MFFIVSNVINVNLRICCHISKLKKFLTTEGKGYLSFVGVGALGGFIGLLDIYYIVIIKSFVSITHHIKFLNGENSAKIV